MSSSSGHTRDVSKARRVDEVCDKFELAWRQCSVPRIEDYLGLLPEQDRRPLFEELFPLELAYRRQLGQVLETEYRERFPEYGSAVESLFREELATDDSADTPGESAPPETICIATMDYRTTPRLTRGVSALGSGTPGTFADYVLMEEIARGGMGIVYRALQLSLNRTVALKMIRSGQLADDDEVKRFQAEARAAANLQHPNIVAVHEIGTCAGHHYFTMDFVQGKSLADVVREQPLAPRNAAAYVREAATAIHHAHEQGVLHRDLKPSNVLIDQDDKVRVTDFGLAKRVQDQSDLTHTAQILGTPSYMPPEQAGRRIKDVGPASDVYSLGATLYDLITGRPPFQAESVYETIDQVLQQEPASPRQLNASIPQDLENICLKCLEKDASKRYASAKDLADDLSRFLRGEPVQARPVTMTDRAWRWCKRNPVIASLSAGLAVALIVGVTGIVTQWIRAERTLVANSAFLEMADGAAQRLLIQVADDPELQQHNLEKLRQRLLTSAQSFYGDLARIDRLANVDKDSPYVLLQRARAYTKLAMITSEIESIWSAREQQKTGLEIIRQTLRHDPNNLDGLAALADGLLYLGFYEYQMGRFLDAHRKWEEALQIINKVVALGPTNYDHLRTKARAHSLLAVFYQDTGNLREAESQQAAVLACLPDLRESGRHLPRGEQETLLEEAGCHMNLAVLYFRKWDMQRARSECEEVLRITKDQGALTFEGLRIIARAYLAWCDYNGGKLTEAETGLRQAIADWKQLGQRHPGVIEYQRRVWYSYHTLAELLARTGRLDDAQATIDDAMKLSTELHKLFGNREEVIQTMLQRGKLYAEQELFEKAEKDLIEVRDIYRSWTSEQSFNIFNFVGFGVACNELARLYSKTKRPNDEKVALEEGLEKWNYLTKYDGYPDHDRGLAMCHLGLGQYFLRQGSLEESKQHLEVAYRACTRLANAYDMIVKNKDLLADALAELGRVHFEQKRQDQAIRKFEDELVLRERLVELCPQDVNYRRKLVACQRQLALLSSPRQ